MLVFFGTRLYGKVDHVPGLFYVATHFAYLQFVPLFPTASYLILDGSESGENFRGVQISMSGKSVLFGYLRAALIIGTIMLLFIGALVLQQSAIGGLVMIAAAVAAIIMVILSYKVTRPGPERALWLAQQAGIDPEVVARFFVDANMVPDDLIEEVETSAHRERRD